MTMIERVARAIAMSQDQMEDYWEFYAGTARAAILAMREPTEEMTKAGASVRTETPEYIAQADKDRAGGMWMSMIGEGGARLHYCAMIDAALKE